MLGSGSVAVAAAEDGALDIGSRRQLFCDRRFIAAAKGISLTLHAPRKAGPILLPEMAWEKRHIGSYLSVIEDGGLYKMWYMSFGAKGGGRLCHATSRDGIVWERPKLGRVEFDGSRANNIAIGSFKEGAVFLDPVAPAGQRFKTLASSGGKGGTLRLLTSPDGVDWNGEYPVLPFHPDSQNCLFWDTRLKKYVAYLRGWNPLRVAVRAEIGRDGILKPWPYRKAENPRYLWSVFAWGAGWPPTLSTEYPTVLRCDRANEDIYTPNVQQYAWADDAYFAFPSIFRHTAPPGSEQIPMAGVLEVQCAVSRDGIAFDRMDRRAYVPLGLSGDYDSHNAFLGLGMIRRGGEIFQYYAGGGTDHASSQPGRSALLRLVQRLDGFVSAGAGTAGGEFVTPLLRGGGGRLLLNIDTGATGSAWVEALGEGLSVPSERIVANGTAFEVKFIHALPAQPLRLRFKLDNARLYAFQFA
ncbi:MAG: hypothetical protein JNK48_05980 [Bryobacterales bacterium]|nr:hypothetical protein [Bryobacterales bacterium]